MQPTLPDPAEPASPDDAGPPGRWRVSNIRPIAIVAVAALVIGGIVLVTPSEQERGLEALGATTLEPLEQPVTVPLREVAGHLVVDAALGSAGEPTGLILDTGAPVILASDLVQRFGGDPAGSIMSASIDGQVTTSDVVPIPSLRLGGATFRDVGAVSGFIEPDSPLACSSDRGLLGASLMQQAVWQIDSAADVVTIAPSVAGLDHIAGAIAIPFERGSEASGSPIIELPAGAGRLRFLVDTGSNGWLSVHPDDLEGTGASLAADAPATDTLGVGASGTFETRLAWTALDLVLGDLALPATPIATTDSIASGQGNIGNAFLSNFIVTVDWTADTLYLEPLETAPRPEAPASVALGWGGEGLIVGAITVGAPGTAGLELGQGVIAVDGVDVTGATFDDFCREYQNGPGGRFEITAAADPPVSVEVAPVEGFYEASER
jgi:hypothetical protein